MEAALGWLFTFILAVWTLLSSIMDGAIEDGKKWMDKKEIPYQNEEDLSEHMKELP